MNTHKLILVVLISLASGVIAFAAARNAIQPPAAMPTPALATDPLFDWLGVSAAKRVELAGHDPGFPDDLRGLRNGLAAARSALATSLEDSGAPDAEIESRVEAVIAAGNATERRITKYILSVRPHLTADQQKRLLGLCAQGVREGRGFCWRQGEGGAGERRGPGLGGGNGNGPGPGFGGGNGPGGGGRNRRVESQER